MISSIVDGFGREQAAIEHNTAVQTGVILMAEGALHTGFLYRDNITPHGWREDSCVWPRAVACPTFA
jgi:hypothetical protein